MRYLSLFSGIEAVSSAWHDFGTPVGFSEIEPFPCAVLAHHYPNVPNLGDVTQITEEHIKSLGAIDIVVFGSPCQDLSAAGKRKGLINADGNITRSGLFFSALNIAHWARKHCGCRFALWENVPGAFSSNKGADFTQVVSLMAGLDDLDTPKTGWGSEGAAVGDAGMLEWSVLDAQWFGVAQRRKRVFALVDFGDWQSRAPILLERESLRGSTPPSRETRQEITNVAGTLAASGGGLNRPAGNGNELDFCIVDNPGRLHLGTELQQAFEIGPTSGRFTDLAPTLDCRAKNGVMQNQLGCGVLTPIAIHTDAQPDEMNFSTETTATLTASQHAGVCTQKNDFAIAISTKQQSQNIGIEVANALGANDYKEPQAVYQTARMVAFGECSEDGTGSTLKMRDYKDATDLVYALAGNTIGRKPENGGNGTGFDDSGACYTLTKTDLHGVCYPINTMTVMGRPSDDLKPRMGLGLGW